MIVDLISIKTIVLFVVEVLVFDIVYEVGTDSQSCIVQTGLINVFFIINDTCERAVE